MLYFLHRFVAIALLLSVVAGCATPNAPTLSDGQRAMCDALNALRSAAISLSDIKPDTTIEQLRGMRTSVGGLVEAARRANTVLQNQSITEMVTAYDAFSRTVDGLNTEQTVGDAAAALRASADKVIAALEQAYTAARCAQ
ncbi:MAG TPA: hypothetical protein GYA08_15285 [Chloroflexi bacterium]|nr:hypothetical protein [Chloroflexota bacterium]